MQSIKSLLNKIKWDKREKPELYSIHYLDRISKKLIELDYNEIKKINGTFIIIERNDEEVNIPTHRIREVRKENKVVWKRKVSNTLGDHKFVNFINVGTF